MKKIIAVTFMALFAEVTLTQCEKIENQKSELLWSDHTSGSIHAVIHLTLP